MDETRYVMLMLGQLPNKWGSSLNVLDQLPN